MYKIGKAKLLLNEYKSFIVSEMEHGRKKEKSWYHTADGAISSNEISSISISKTAGNGTFSCDLAIAIKRSVGIIPR